MTSEMPKEIWAYIKGGSNRRHWAWASGVPQDARMYSKYTRTDTLPSTADLLAVKEALEFYADKKTYHSGTMSEGGHFYTSHIAKDGGEKAQKALAIIERFINKEGK